MIRINLLRDSGSAGVASVESGTSSETKIHSLKPSDLVVKGIAFALPLLLFIMYRGYTELIQSRQLKALKTQLSTTQDKLKLLDPAVKEMDRFQIEKHKLDSQLDVIKQLSRERLKNVKSLDALQGIIPAHAWLRELKLTDDKVELSGLATDDLVISEFMSSLEASIYFANVTLVSSEEFKSSTGIVKAFTVKCVLENL
jgi:Tfp pilus assembly protein PilN